MNDSYPLRWPPQWPRTENWTRTRGPFQMPAGKARHLLLRELDLLGAENVVVSSNVMIRRDGMPYAKQPLVDDPGVVLYFSLRGKEVAIPSDRWSTIDANLRAIGMTVEAIRGLERWGTGQMVDAAFTGFAALPANVIVTPDTTRPWHEVLEVSPTSSSEVIRAAFKQLALKYHPDRGGDQQQFEELQRAYRESGASN